LTALITKV